MYFGNKKENPVTLPHSAQRNHAFLVETKEKYKSKKVAPKNKVSLELLHHRLGHISTRSLMAGDTENVWKDIELRIYPEPFCTSCEISSINKKDRSKNPFKPKSPFKWFFMDIIPEKAPKHLTRETNFSNYLLIFCAY